MWHGSTSVRAQIQTSWVSSPPETSAETGFALNEPAVHGQSLWVFFKEQNNTGEKKKLLTVAQRTLAAGKEPSTGSATQRIFGNYCILREIKRLLEHRVAWWGTWGKYCRDQHKPALHRLQLSGNTIEAWFQLLVSVRLFVSQDADEQCVG